MSAPLIVSRQVMAQAIEHGLKIIGQIAREFHAPAVGGMLEGQPGGVQEGAFQSCDCAQVSGNSAVDAAI